MNHSPKPPGPAKTDLAKLVPAKPDSGDSVSAQAHSAEPAQAEPDPAPHKTAPAAPTRPQTTNLAIVASGIPPQDWQQTKRKSSSSVRTSKQRVNPGWGWCTQTA